MKKKDMLIIALIAVIIAAVIVGGYVIVSKGNPGEMPKTITTESNRDTLIESEKPDFDLDTDNKYILHTDERFLSMQNDGGSHTDLYFEIDLDNNKITKVIDDYKVETIDSKMKMNKTSTKVYVKDIDSNFSKELKTFLDSLNTEIDESGESTYEYYTIEGRSFAKNISSTTTIDKIKSMIERIDNI